jgi:hypothetical protein
MPRIFSYKLKNFLLTVMSSNMETKGWSCTWSGNIYNVDENRLLFNFVLLSFSTDVFHYNLKCSSDFPLSYAFLLPCIFLFAFSVSFSLSHIFQLFSLALPSYTYNCLIKIKCKCIFFPLHILFYPQKESDEKREKRKKRKKSVITREITKLILFWKYYTVLPRSAQKR